MALVIALVGAYGMFLVYTRKTSRPPRRLRRPQHFGTSAVAAIAGGAAAYGLTGGVIVPAGCAVAGAITPISVRRARNQKRRAEAREAWPRMIEEMRILTASLGQSIPQALFESGSHAPAELTPAFATAHREWLMTTDFNRTLAVLKDRLDDPTADAACETLLVAHQVGGGDLDRRLLELAEDRRRDLQGRKDASARQAGARFARRFVILVPVGMTLAGLAIGPGRAAYASTGGQVGAAAAAAMVAVCWVWAGQLMRLPDEQRVFHEA
jgi:tight adherence protein B